MLKKLVLAKLKPHVFRSEQSRFHAHNLPRKTEDLIENAFRSQIGFETSQGGKPKAVNVTVKQALRSRTFVASKEIIVTSGFYGTPALLLKSGVGPAEELQVMEVLLLTEVNVAECAES